MDTTNFRSNADPLSFVIGTSSWCALRPRQKPEITEPIYIVIHHTGTIAISSGGTLQGAEELARAIQRNDMARGLIDSGHNFLITIGGFVLEGRHGTVKAIRRGKCVRSRHTTAAHNSPGIEMEGNFSVMPVNENQWKALVKLVTVICHLTKIDPEYIIGHKLFDATECPGHALSEDLPRLRLEVQQGLNELNAPKF